MLCFPRAWNSLAPIGIAPLVENLLIPTNSFPSREHSNSFPDHAMLKKVNDFLNRSTHCIIAKDFSSPLYKHFSDSFRIIVAREKPFFVVAVVGNKVRHILSRTACTFFSLTFLLSYVGDKLILL